MQVDVFPVGDYQTNCYMVYGQTDKCVLIDPGYQPEALLEQVRSKGKTVEAILLTHGHFDHVGGVKKIAQETGCRVYIGKEDLSLPPMLTAGPLYYTDTYDEGDAVIEAGLSFAVAHTPGHTPGSVCLLCGDVMFSGDTLFAGSCGRTDFPGGSYDTIMKSLAKLAALEEDYRVLPGHGEETTLSRERRFNPFMQDI